MRLSHRKNPSIATGFRRVLFILVLLPITAATQMGGCGGGGGGGGSGGGGGVASIVLSLLAGGLGGSGNVDGTGDAARFYGSATNPSWGVATDGTNVFVADQDNFTVRQVVISTGVVTTLAGTAGSAGTADGTGAAARFSGPRGLATDGTNVFVADDQTIRQVVISTGVVTTLAGTAASSGSADGTGAAARFNTPRGVATDGVSVFVADTNNHTIRRIIISTAVVTTLAGTAGSIGSTDGTGPAARFSSPTSVATEGTNVFVADTNNHTIRQIAISTAVVTTLAGTAGSSGSTDGAGAAARFSSPQGVGTTMFGTSVFVADTSNHTIRRLVIATGGVTTLAGTAGTSGSTDGTGATARFNNPRGIAATGANLFVGDNGNFTIRQIFIATAAVTTLAGKAPSPGSTDGTGAAARFNGPQAVATDGTNVFVADSNNHTIRQIVIATGVVTTLAGTAGLSGSTNGTGAAARFNNPRGVATDGTNVFVADTSNQTIRQIVIATGAVTTLAGTAGLSGSADGTGAAARFSGLTGVATDGTNVFVADTGNHTIRQIVISTGVVTTLAGTAASSGSTDGAGAAARFSGPTGVATDGTNVFVADTNNHTIRKIVLAGASVSTIVGVAGKMGVQPGPLPASLSGPTGVAFIAGGRLAIAAPNENSVLVSNIP